MRRTILLLAITLSVALSRPGFAVDLVVPSASTADNDATVWWWAESPVIDVAAPSKESARGGNSLPTVADTITRAIRVATEPGVTVEWPASLVVGGDLGGLTISAIRDEPPRVDEQGRIVSVRVLELEPFLPGDFELGPIEFSIRREGDPSVETLTLPPTQVTIAPLFADDAPIELAGPKGVVDAPEQAAEDLTLWIVGGSAAVAICAAFGAALVLRRNGLEQSASPSERALEELAALEDLVRGEGTMGQRPTNERAYTVLSSILRTYIEARFGYRATARTTEEFLRDAADSRAGRLPTEAAQQLRAVLEACDEVKFAGAEPGMAAAGRAIDEVRAFVESFGDQEEETA
jgi:hypothetical protein